MFLNFHLFQAQNVLKFYKFVLIFLLKKRSKLDFYVIKRLIVFLIYDYLIILLLNAYYQCLFSWKHHFFGANMSTFFLLLKKSQPQNVLKLFLILDEKWGSCSYKIGSYKKKKSVIDKKLKYRVATIHNTFLIADNFFPI